MPKPANGAWLTLGVVAGLAVAGAAQRGARARPGEFLYAHFILEYDMAVDPRTRRVESVPGSTRQGVRKDGQDVFAQGGDLDEELQLPAPRWLEAHAMRAEPSTPQDLLDLLGLNMEAEALTALGEVPAWVLAAATVAKEMREKKLHMIEKNSVYSTTRQRWERLDILEESEPFPTPRGGLMQRGWPKGARDLIWMMLPNDWHHRAGVYGWGPKVKSDRVKATTLAKIMSVPPRKVIKAAGL